MPEIGVFLQWALIGGCLYGAVVQLAVWWADRRQRVHLAFGLACMAVAAYIPGTMAIYRAETAAQMVLGLKWRWGMGLVAFTCIAWFMALYAQVRVWRLLVGYTAVGFLLVLADVLLPPDLLFADIRPVLHVGTGGGRFVWTVNWWWVTLVYAQVWACHGFGYYAAWRTQHRGERYLARLLVLAFVPLTLASVLGMFSDLGLVRPLYLAEYAFVGFLVVVAYSLARDLDEARSKLLRRLAFERLVSETFSELAGTRGSGIEAAIERALAAIGGFIEADRAYIFRFQEGQVQIDNIHEWCAPGIEPRAGALRDVSLDEYLPWFAERIRGRQVSYAPDTADLPPEAQRERVYLEAQGIRSIVVVPMETGDHLTGFLGFEVVRGCRTWSDEDRTLLCFAGQAFSHVIERQWVEAALSRSEARFRNLFEQSPESIVLVDQDGRILDYNHERSLTGFARQDLVGRNLFELGVFDRYKSGVREVLDGQIDPYELQVETPSRGHIWLEVHPAVVDGVYGRCVRFIVSDITARKRQEQVQAALLRLIEYAAGHSVIELLQKLVDEAKALTGSEIGFCHFLQDDQETLSFQTWSTNTLGMCTAEGAGRHNPLSQAGMGVDCIREREPVIHNDYASLPHKKAPEGHMPLVRELVVPVLRQDRVVAILGVGNKRMDYQAYDVEAVQRLADLAWETVIHKQIEASLRESNEFLHSILQNTPSSVFVRDLEGRYLLVNRQYEQVIGLTQEQAAGKHPEELHRPRAAAQIARDDHLVLETDQPLTWEETILVDDEPHSFVATKVPLRDAVGRPYGLCTVATDITERVHAEAERMQLLAQIQGQAQQLQQIMDAVPEGLLLLDTQHRVVTANPAAQRDLCTLASAGVESGLESLGGYPLDMVLTWSGEQAWQEIEVEGRIFAIAARSMPEAAGWVLVIRDMSREREMQAHMRHQDRLAVIGQLAGGVAHDFNNILTAIQGYAALVAGELPAGDPMHTDIEEISAAADRAAALTMQLLVFSRKQVIHPQVLDPNLVIVNMNKMLRRIIGEQINFQTRLDPDAGSVRVDPTQLEQVIMNLSVNARDAMPGGGQLIVSTQNVTLALANTALYPDIEPGPYVLLSVCDTGCGMSEEVRSHLFEPFFTTKERGKGTGLGLSTVYGIVKQAGGHIEVTSRVGEGSTFQIYLPRIKAEPVRSEPSSHDDVSTRGAETILIVEDEDTVRELAHRVLERQGYTVLTARLPQRALELMQHYVGPLSLLITDVVMPGMGGPELAQQMRRIHPDLRVLYMSGYTDNELSLHGVLAPDVVLLPKPFGPSKLVQVVREVLDMPGVDIRDGESG